VEDESNISMGHWRCGSDKGSQNLVLAPVCQPQVSQRMVWNWTQALMVRDQ